MTFSDPAVYTFILEHFGVAVSAVAGALAARGRRVDLFGVVVLALVTALGGGTIRDVCLGATPVFWIQDPRYVATATLFGLGTFIVARRRDPPMNLLELADAFGLAFFTMAGARKSLAFEAGPAIAVALGTITGVAGGIVRDVLLNELPLVFRKEIRLYATAAMLGAGVFVALRVLGLAEPWPAVVGMVTTLGLRLAAIRWDWALPVFEAGNPPR
ncbi:MAG: trimeric intracellular cation channel family protein [Verrucomicrobiales bacterium]|nr:trimeric intracellular cation channel family protein [Verrucomicrobiales bacterium]